MLFSSEIRFDSDRDFEFGDAGLVWRASNLSTGTDSMYGYYAGIRPGTQTLKLGRMEDDYTDLAMVKLSEPVRIGVWYRLSINVRECHFEVQLSDDQEREIGVIRYDDRGCVIRTGRVGLRAYSMITSWRNLLLQP